MRRSATDLHFCALVNVLRDLWSEGLVCHTRRLHPPAIDRGQNPRGPAAILIHGMWWYVRVGLRFREV